MENIQAKLFHTHFDSPNQRFETRTLSDRAKFYFYVYKCWMSNAKKSIEFIVEDDLRNGYADLQTRSKSATSRVTYCFYWVKYSLTIEWE